MTETPNLAPKTPDPAPPQAPAFRRRVFYIPGYDPFHPRRYRELYRAGGRDQAAMLGYDLALKPKTGADRYGWHVSARIEGRAVEAEVEVLVWSDIVRATMDQSIPGTYAQMLRTVWAYIGTGTLRRLTRLRWGPIAAAVYPIGMLCGYAVLALLSGAGLLILGRMLVPGVAGWVAGGMAGIGAAIAMLRWFRARDNRFYAYYLMHDYGYSASHGGANPPALEARMAEFAARIRAALSEDLDEVLVVGHSSGAHLGVSILADLLRAGLPQGAAPLSFLSLGHVVPMVSFLPKAGRLRRDLRFMGSQSAVPWVDVTAPGDGCAFALCDPVKVTGVAAPDQRWPLVLTAAFSQTLRPETWKANRRAYFKLHFQYLKAFDNLTGAPDEYDYFRITAGPQTLWGRLGARAPAKSRIDRVANVYTDCAP